MPLPPGTKLGSFTITGTLGAGGMGEVYRARDERLDRDVALKFVLGSVLADRERTLRFEREARTLAAINHPSIATLHEIQRLDGHHFLVMELVPGETLAERIARHPTGLPVEEALQIARQICDGLEAAHEKGIVHRDLKPANVKITPDDKVKILDFGLARTAEASNAVSASFAHSPTVSALGTQAGVILGTASYMSPEQARGYTADHRSDIFSFGIVLYEMLTGRQPFPGETISDVIAAILVREPDLTAVRAGVAPRLTDLLRRCLEKNPKQRWQAIGDVRYEIDALLAAPRIEAAPVPSASPAPLPSLWRRARPFGATALLTTLLVGLVVWFAIPRPEPPEVVRFALALPEGQTITAFTRGALAVSPDGKQLAYIANRQIYVRALAELQTKRIYDNEGRLLTNHLTFAPDGRSIAFWSGGSLYRLASAGGTPFALVSLERAPTAVSWSGEWLLYSHQNRVYRLPAAGGRPEILIEASAEETVTAPELLPDGQTVLYTTATGTAANRWDGGKIVAQRPGEPRTVILEGGGDARYVASGHLLYVQRGVLFAVRFDASRLRAEGTGVPVIEGVRRGGLQVIGAAHVAVSRTGTVIYLPGPVTPSLTPQLVLASFERGGGALPLKVPPGPYSAPRMSPDGRLVTFVSDDGREVSIWVYDVVAGGSPRRLTFGGENLYPTWSADSRFVTFQSNREGMASIYHQLADGSGVAERLTTAGKDRAHIPHSWSPDGSVLLYDEFDGKEYVLHALLRKDTRAEPFGRVRSVTPTGAVFSPDGRWVAYSSRVSPQPSTVVFVQPYPATGALFQVSNNTEDGHHQVWAPDGRELYYTPEPGAVLIGVPVRTKPAFALGEPVNVARPFTNDAPSAPRTFDAIGQGRFLGLTGSNRADSAGPSQLHVILNWFEELNQRTAVR